VHALPSSQAFVLLVKTQPIDGLHVSVVQTLLSLQTTGVPAWHVPPPHTSPLVQAFPSSQGAELFVNTQPVAGLQLSLVQTLLSLQTTGVPAWQVPPPQVSPVVHAFPSSQAAALFVWTQPVAGLHESSVHGLLSLQVTAAPAWQVPLPQVSPAVQAFPSSQAAVLFAWTHPVAGLHVSSVHGLLSLQSTGEPPWQMPPPHVPPTTHRSPASQGFVLFVWAHPVAGSHESSVHGLPSSQEIGVPAHTPPLQVSPDVQALPSSQVAALFVNTQPEAGSHESSVHGLLSLHTTAAPAWHVPPEQVSPLVQAFPSSQALVLLLKTQPVAGLQVSVVQTLPSLQTTGAPG
jgi:hypothetical protein